MASEITMPQLSDTMTEGTVVKWHKKEGEAVKAGEEIADVETDKATMPMESFDSGTLAFIAVKEGQKAKVGQVLAVVATPGENVAEVRKSAVAGQTKGEPSRAAEQAFVAAPPDIEANHPKLEEDRRHERREAVEGGHPEPQPGEAITAVAEAPGHIKVSPLARRLAADKGVDLALLRGTGPGGRIVERDVQTYVEQGGSVTPPPAAPAPAAPAAKPAPLAPPAARPVAPVILTGQTQTIPMTKMRSAIAAALQRSKQLIPHFYETADIDMEAVLALRQKLNGRLEKEGVRLSISDFVMKAVASALMAHPVLNARFNPDKGEITRYGDVNLGIAVSIPDGLIVPVLRGINRMGLRDIRIRSLDLIDRARAQRLKREEQTEATFTVSSLGSNGIREFSAIINPPEVGILAIGSASKRPAVQGDQIVPRTMMTVTLSADHRVVDGATAADFLVTLRDILEEPGMMLA